MEILNQNQVRQKIKRLAIEVVEHNYQESEIILIGINNTGMKFAKLLQARLQKISAIHFPLAHLKINPRNPLDPSITLDIPTESLNDKVVLLIDDVANSGRTLFYACKPIMEVLPKRLETVVLVNRTHKHFPIQVNYFGLALATTLKEHIKVTISGEKIQVKLVD
jgi:pyrimidine operon attenuation protein/uracil phosphoribosyltransferase